MADYKDYIVRYDIQANTVNAAEGLKAMATAAQQLQEPLAAVERAMTQVASSAKLLKMSFKDPLVLTLDTKTFQSQLNTMVSQVQEAAAKMHAAIFNALKGSPQGTTAAQTGIGRALDGKRTIADVKRAIAETERELTKILGPWTKDKRGKAVRDRRAGSLYMTRKDPVEQARLQALKSDLQTNLKAYKAELQQMEKAQQQIAAAQAKATTQAKATAAATPKPVSNVTAAQIKAWRQFFGTKNVKSLTLEVVDKATPTINAVKTSLEGLAALGKFEIIPTINQAAYTEAERRLAQLVALSQKITQPFTGSKGSKATGVISDADKAKLNAAQQQLKTLNAAAAPIQQRLNKNLAIAEDQRSRGVKAQITKDTKALGVLATQAKEQEQIIGAIKGKKTAAAPLYTIPVGIKLMTESIAPTLEAIAPTLPPLNIKVHLLTEGVKGQIQALSGQSVSVKGGNSTSKATTTTTVPPKPVYLTPKWAEGTLKKAAQLQKVSSKLPPINLTLNIEPALAKLAEFIAAVKSSSPQNIVLTAGGAAGGSTSKSVSTGKSTTKTGASTPPLSPRQYRDNLGKALERPTPISDKIINQRLGIGGMGSRAAAPSGIVGSGKNMVSFGSSRPSDALAPKGYHWERTTGLATRLTGDRATAFNQLDAQRQAALQNLRRVVGETQPLLDHARTFTPQSRNISRLQTLQSTISQNYRAVLSRKAHARQAYQSLEQQITPYRQQYAQLEEMKKPFAQLKKLNSTQKRALARIEAAQRPLMTQIEQLESQQSQIASTIYNANDRLRTLQSRGGRVSRMLSSETANERANAAAPAIAQRQAAAAAARSVNAAVIPYTHGWQLAKDQTPPAPSRLSRSAIMSDPRYQRILAQRHNALLPFNLSASQMDAVKKNWRFFAQASKSTGIIPTAGMEQAQMLRYLQAVSAQMQTANAPVPLQLQKQIQSLESGSNPTNGRGGSRVVWGAAPRTPAFDRFRKWAYPLTGNTSFGARTPMAVDMAKGMGMMFAIGGAMSAIGSSFSQAMEYQNTMRTTKAILQHGTNTYSASGFRNMERTVRDVGVRTKFSAPEVANASRFLAMAGYDIDAINAAIRPIADLALIGDMDLGEVADKMTNIMTVFGATADVLKANPGRMREMANIMTTTATRSNTDLMMLAESAKYGGGVAQMYGRNDPNLFADTMAIFGVMGNAGVQGSSAGTSLRMMYQNIFKPNKNQKRILDMLKNTYGISTINDDGSFRAMSEILIEMAQRIPEDQMAKIVGSLFRITAQPGATAAIMAAAGGDANAAQEIVAGNEAVVQRMSSKAGLSALVSLMMANRNSINGNISGAVSEEKQNTISGLWAQVSSMFTEAIVKAFEQREGGFAEMLKKIRDYFANPETVTMIQNLIDMIVEVGKVMAWFVKVWASLYNAVPGLVKWWIIIQMSITQIGTLIAPLVQLVGAFNRLGGAILGLSGVSTVAAANVTRAATSGAVAAGAAASNVPFIVGTGAFGRNLMVRGNIARRAHQAIANNAILAGELALSGADRASTLKSLNKGTVAHYAAVRARANRIYGWGRVTRNFKSAATAGLSMASVTPALGGVKSVFMGLMGTLAKGFGLLLNPITAIVTAFAGLGYGLYKLTQIVNGTTESQKRARAQANQAMDDTNRELGKEAQWYKDIMNADIPTPMTVISSVNTEAIQQYNERQEKFKALYAGIFNDFSQNASNQTNADVMNKWRGIIRNNPIYTLALRGTSHYDMSKKHRQIDNSSPTLYYGGDRLGTIAWNMANRSEDDAINYRYGMVQDALAIEGANDYRTQKAVQDVIAQRQKYLAGIITLEEYNIETDKIRATLAAQLPGTAQAAGMTPERFKQTTDRSYFDTYQKGALNLLNATIEGQLGTMTGKLNAYKWFSDTANKAKMYTTEWYNAIANIIGDYHVIFNAVSQDGKMSANIELMLQMMPDGTINADGILAQIREKIANYQLTLQSFSDIVAHTYKMLAEAGVLDVKDKAGFKKLIRTSMTGVKYTEETYRQYWKDWIDNNPESEWKKAGVQEQEYVDFMMGRSGETFNLPNRVVSRTTEKGQMTWNLADRSAETVMTQINNAKKLTSQSSPQGGTTTNTDQDAYASHYDRSVARPTQVVININEMAHFDRTTVASSAEERDLIAAMEAKIAPAVYQIFAQAANQANNMSMA